MRYDALGNMTHKNNVSEGRNQTLLYDFYNRLLVVREGEGANKKNVGRYWYDEQGFRVRKNSKQTVYGTENGEEVSAIRWYELDYHNQYFAIERQKNEYGRVIENTEYSINNIYLNGVRIAAMEESGAARYFLTDQVDSVKVVADDSGNAVSRVEYMPYGQEWFSEGADNFAPKYNSQELDKESDLYYFNARHYDPELARFVSADTVVDGVDTTAGWNRYMYVKGNPIAYKDPTGHIRIKIPFTEKYLVIQQKPEAQGGGLRADVTTKEEGTHIDPAPSDNPIKNLFGEQKISFKNDNPKKGSADKKVKFELAETVEGAVKDTGQKININSSVRTGKGLSRHNTKQAVDINRVDNKRVDDPSNFKNVKKLQKSLQKQDKIRENFGPAFQTKKLAEKKGKAINRPDQKAKHGNHIHASVSD